MEPSAEAGSCFFSAIDVHLVCSLATTCDGGSKSISSPEICHTTQKDIQPHARWRPGSLWILLPARTTNAHFLKHFSSVILKDYSIVHPFGATQIISTAPLVPPASSPSSPPEAYWFTVLSMFSFASLSYRHVGFDHWNTSQILSRELTVPGGSSLWVQRSGFFAGKQANV